MQNYEQWPDDKDRQDFPFVDGATALSVDQQLRIEQSMILDARLWPSKAVSRLWLSAIEVQARTIVWEISDVNGVVLTATQTDQDLTRTKLVFYDQVGAPTGWLKLSPATAYRLRDLPHRRYVFTDQATTFCPTASTPLAAEGLQEVGDGRVFISGDIALVCARGVQAEADGNTITIHGDGDPFYRRSTCEDPEKMGKLLNPLRGLQIRDYTTGVSYRLIPNAGQFMFSVQPVPNGKPLFHSPGPTGQLLAGVL